jgi:hypothetical protein
VAERPTRFDPYTVLELLDRHGVTYIVIGVFARAIHGADELTRGVDIVPSTLRLRSIDAEIPGASFGSSS